MSAGGILRLSVHAVFISALMFAVWALLRTAVLHRRKRIDRAPAVNRRREVLLWVLVFYLLCLYQITVFRYGINPELWFAWGDSLDSVNLTPFVHTIKLYYAYTKWFFIYNLLGNIVWFIPLGTLLPAVFSRCHFLRTTVIGFLCSLSIELLQFIFATGISDIDDLMFNTLGTVLGFLLYLLGRRICRAVSRRNATRA